MRLDGYEPKPPRGGCHGKPEEVVKMEDEKPKVKADELGGTPKLACPNCGVDLIAAHGRGLHNANGEYIEHRDGCRCAWCDWMWFDDHEPATCECGARVVVRIDDDRAFSSMLEQRCDDAQAATTGRIRW
jgi:hypothetical protein